MILRTRSLQFIALAALLVLVAPAAARQARAAIPPPVGVVSSSASVDWIASPPTVLEKYELERSTGPGSGALESDTVVRAFHELSGFKLTSPVVVDTSVPGAYPFYGAPATLPAGTWVNSYFVYADKLGGTGHATYSGSITFADDIIGIISRDGTLVGSTLAGLRTPGTTYYTSGGGFGMEFVGGTPLSSCSEDCIILSADRKTVQFKLLVGGAVDQMRILTSAPADSTPPSVTPNVSGTLGQNGWYTSPVTVTWTVTDPDSGITSQTGCASTTIGASTAGQTLTCSATSAGGTASQSVTVKVDTSAPSIDGAPTCAQPGQDGWCRGPVTVDFTCADTPSGVAACSPDQTVSGDGAGKSATGSATDNAGNTASKTVGGINIYATGPTITASPSPAPNANGWNNTAVTVTFNCTDATSGVASVTPPTTVSAQGANQSVPGTCTDKAGNSASTTATVNIDTTGPTISGAATCATPGANGWCKGPVTVTYTCNDALSLIATCPAPVTISAAGIGQSVTGTATDKAGNSTSATVGGINIDATAPVVAVTGVTGGSTYTVGGAPAAACKTDDPLSGVATNASVSVTGANANGVGTATVTCAGGTDKAGNTAPPTTVTYKVEYGWGGCKQPILVPIQTFNQGNTVPIKCRLVSASGATISTAVVKLLVNGQAGTAKGGPNSGNTFRYDAADQHYIFNLDTEPLREGTVKLQAVLDDGTTRDIGEIMIGKKK